MDLRSIFPILLTIAFVNADCSSGVQNCLKNYNQKVQSHITDKNALCTDVDNYINCVFSQGCDIGATQKQQMIDSTKTEMDKLSCSFTMADLINRYGNSASVVSPRYTLLIVVLSSIFVFLRDHFA